MKEQVAIFGAGLLGGSLALALEAKGWQVSLHARRAQSLDEWDQAHPRSSVFVSTQMRGVLAQARLVVLAVPPLAMKAVLEQILEVSSAPETLLVTDVGSVKESIEAELMPLCEAVGAQYLGSHPMAGGEQSGLAAANANLFAGSVCALCPQEASPAEDVLRLSNLWAAVGCEVLEMDAKRHDALVAKVSHGVHFAATALMQAAVQPDELLAAGEALALAGSGIRDSTRIAASDADLWVEIAQGNRAPLVAALSELEGQVAQVRQLIEGEDWAGLEAYLEEAARWRKGLA